MVCTDEVTMVNQLLKLRCGRWIISRYASARQGAGAGAVAVGASAGQAAGETTATPSAPRRLALSLSMGIHEWAQVDQHLALFWTTVMENLKDQDQEGIKFYEFLQKSALVDPMELMKFGISDGLAAQRPEEVIKLRSVTDVFNNMMPIRQRYLYKYIHGERGSGEITKMEKRLRKGVELSDQKIQDIRDGNAFCPQRSKLFDNYPRPLKN
ncbi:hypothetical protein TRIUR3_14799 [Triticum urartu]|uniref:Uncharacterized protein n=1 Tax=Triticum urartu TaxID=4572 RepID=M7ZAV8_TRIUA|nr:hypothetical protein TRIUR3_14799 [Triticum urartu]